MQVLRLYDPERRPPDWCDVIRQGQFAVFAKEVDSGVPCDGEGVRFAQPSAATCLLFDSIEDARAFCARGIARHPHLQYDVFDADGRTRPPLLTVLHSTRARAAEVSSASARLRRVLAGTLIVAGVGLGVRAYLLPRESGLVIVFGFIGINMVLAGGRLLWMNLIVRETERAREARLARASDGTSGRPA